MARTDYLVKLPDGSFVTLYARFHTGKVPQYTTLASQPGRASAVRMSFNVAQAVARRAQAIVIAA